MRFPRQIETPATLLTKCYCASVHRTATVLLTQPSVLDKPWLTKCYCWYCNRDTAIDGSEWPNATVPLCYWHNLQFCYFTSALLPLYWCWKTTTSYGHVPYWPNASVLLYVCTAASLPDTWPIFLSMLLRYKDYQFWTYYKHCLLSIL